MDELPLLVESVHASNNAERNRQKYGRQLSLLSQTFPKSQRTVKSICCKSPAKARASWPHLCVLSTWTSRLPPQATSSNRICFKLRVFPPLRTTSTSDQHTMRPMNKGLNTRFCRTGLGRKMSGLFAAKKILQPRSAYDQTTSQVKQRCWICNFMSTVKMSISNTYLTRILLLYQLYLYMQWQASIPTRVNNHAAIKRPTAVQTTSVAKWLWIWQWISQHRLTLCAENTKVTPLLSFGKVAKMIKNDLGKEKKKGRWDTYQQVASSCKHLGELEWN